MKLELNGRRVIDSEIECDPLDGPEFEDAYFVEAQFDDGTHLTNAELDALAIKYPQVLREAAQVLCEARVFA